MKKILYYLPNIVLGIYLLIYIPLQRIILINLPESYINKYGFEVYLMPYDANLIMNKISIGILVVSGLLKVFFNSKKCNSGKSDKILGIILFIVELIILFILKTLTAFA